VSIEETLRSGDLGGTLALLQEQVRKNPAKVEGRVLLFQLFALLGQWERALTQLDVLRGMNATMLPLATTYAEAVRSEVFRAEVFAGRRAPLIFGQPAPWMALLLQSLSADAARAKSLRDEALEQAPTTAGTLNGAPFSWIADADTRMGPMLEAVMNGRYYWIPFSRLRAIKLEAPADLRDFVWMPAELTFANEGQSVALLPARYPGSETVADDAIRLGRRTEWQEVAAGVHHGLGQRMLATDVDEYPLQDVRDIQLEVTATDGVTDPAA
jgi:type VI secretion system protein ImpE